MYFIVLNREARWYGWDNQSSSFQMLNTLTKACKKPRVNSLYCIRQSNHPLRIWCPLEVVLLVYTVKLFSIQINSHNEFDSMQYIFHWLDVVILKTTANDLQHSWPCGFALGSRLLRMLTQSMMGGLIRKSGTALWFVTHHSWRTWLFLTSSNWFLPSLWFWPLCELCLSQ